MNGKLVEEKTKVKHGDRILWGNNHYFRINCPRLPGLYSVAIINILGNDYSFLLLLCLANIFWGEGIGLRKVRKGELRREGAREE